MSMDIWAELREAALLAKSRAYCRYSKYPVGSAVKTSNGRLYAGCNVENVSFGLTICAERNAVGQMIASGDNHIRWVLVISRDGAAPCGMCLQSLLEFADPEHQVLVRCEDGSGGAEEYTLKELMPYGFQTDLE